MTDWILRWVKNGKAEEKSEPSKVKKDVEAPLEVQIRLDGKLYKFRDGLVRKIGRVEYNNAALYLVVPFPRDEPQPICVRLIWKTEDKTWKLGAQEGDDAIDLPGTVSPFEAIDEKVIQAPAGGPPIAWISGTTSSTVKACVHSLLRPADTEKGFLHLAIGLIEHGSNELALLFYPHLSNAGNKYRFAVPLRGLTQKIPVKRGACRAGPGWFWYGIGEKNDDWQGLIDLWPRRIGSDDMGTPSGLSSADVLHAWNHSVKTAQQGLRLARGGMPALLLPGLSISSQTPHIHVSLSSAGLRVISLAPHAQTTGSKNTIELGFDWQAQTLDGDEKNPAKLILQATVTEPPGAIDRDAEFPSLSTIASVELKPELMHIGLEDIKADGPTKVVLGALEIEFDSTGNSRSGGELSLDGLWNSECIDVFPDIKLKNIPCRVRLSGTGDVAERDVTVLDGADKDEESQQRETEPVIGDSQAVFVPAELDIEVSAEPGQMPLSKLTLRLQRRANDSKSLYLQIRPFFVAEFGLGDVAFESEDALTWRSDDPEGPKWRVALRQQSIKLPPQAVGEEMERGKRFWRNGQRSITGNAPVKYRFSPPTRLTIAPVRPRQNTPLQANLLDSFRDASLVKMTTEMVYPLQIDFKRDARNKPDVRIVEVSNFYGKPPQSLPPTPPKTDQESVRRLMETVMDNDLAAAWLASGRDFSAFLNPYSDLRKRHVAARSNFTARLAILQLYDPYREDKKLELREGLTFRLRDTKMGAPPLANPLPNGESLNDETKTSIAAFLENSDWGKGNDSIAAGLIFTLEDAGELRNVLGAPSSRDGVIDELKFSALGASGSVSVAFDGGLTQFTASVRDGQVSRIMHVRLGRIALFWNKARHVTIYERSTVTSQQFHDEQASLDEEDPLVGWPVLRKTEEYIDILQPLRRFSEEPSSSDNSTGFVDSLFFASERIYVNSAWKRSLKDAQENPSGYEIPLWNPNADQYFYAKPRMALQGSAGEGLVTRMWCDEPQHLYFYSSTVPEASSDSDQWSAIPGVDLSCLPRAGLSVAPEEIDGSRMKSDSYLQPDRELPREARFAIALQAEGPIDLQHQRNDSPMLAKMDIIQLGRTSEIKPEAKPNALEKSLQEISLAAARLGRVDKEIESLQSRLLAIASNPGNLNCATLVARLREEKERLILSLRNAGAAAYSQLPELKPQTPKLFSDLRDEVQHLTGLPQEWLDTQIALAEALLKRTEEQAKDYADKNETRLLLSVQSSCDSLNSCLSALFKEARSKAASISGAITDAKKALAPLSKAKANLGKVIAALAGNEIENARKALVEARKEIQKVPATAMFGGAARRCLQIIEVAEGLIKSLENSATDAKDLLTVLTVVITALEQKIMGLGELENTIDDFVDVHLFKLQTTTQELLKLAKEDIQGHLQEWFNNVKAKISDLREHLSAALKNSKDEIAGSYAKIRSQIDSDLAYLLAPITDVESLLYEKLDQSQAQLQTDFGNRVNDLETSLEGIIKNIGDKCEEIVTEIGKALAPAKEWAEAQGAALRKQLIESGAEDVLKRAAKDVDAVADKASSAIKLVKALGEMPALPTLSFNIERAEYVFSDAEKAIKTSPFVAKLKEVEGQLSELGLAQPCHEIAEHLKTDIDALTKDVQTRISEVVKGLAAIDFRKFCPNLNLREDHLNHLKNDAIKMTHVMDCKSRSAWVKAELNMNEAARQDAMDLGAIKLEVSKLRLKGQSELQIRLGETPRSIQTGEIAADWHLGLGGQNLVTFRDTRVVFDAGGRMNVDFSPDRMELHPSLKVIQDFAGRLASNLPPWLVLEKDERGKPTGVQANIIIPVRLPTLGAVTVSPFDIHAGMAMRQGAKGFAMSSHVLIGSRNAPVFIQISLYGGGFWLEAHGRESGTVVNIGMAAGSMRALNFGAIARGSYQILLYFYAELQDTASSTIRGGLLVAGSALLLGYLDASLRLSLEAKHQGGQMNGEGIIDVKVKICWGYSVHVKRRVKHKF